MIKTMKKAEIDFDELDKVIHNVKFLLNDWRKQQLKFSRLEIEFKNTQQALLERGIEIIKEFNLLMNHVKILKENGNGNNKASE